MLNRVRLTMAPLIVEDLVLIGPVGSENAISGWVGACRLRDGSAVWKFQTVPGATLAGSESWPNPKRIKLGWVRLDALLARRREGRAFRSRHESGAGSASQLATRR